MKTILITIALTLTVAIMTAQADTTVTTQGTTITVTVPVQTDDGTVFFALQDEATFMKRTGLLNIESPIVDGIATAVFENVAPGVYGVILFHDINGNKTMDFEANGMPKEMYGVSNNVMSYGPPMWNDAKFEVSNEPIAMEIRM